MAEQKRKTQAEKAASAAKMKKNAAKNTSATSKTSGKKIKQEAAVPVKENQIPVRFITSCAFLGLFVLLLVLYLNPEGAITKFLANFQAKQSV